MQDYQISNIIINNYLYTIKAIYEPSKYTYDYTYDNPLILSLSYSSNTIKNTYTYVDTRLIKDTIKDNTYLYDGKYSISEISLNTNNDNTLSLRYDIYGNITNTNLSQEDKIFSYNTLEYTPQNKLTYIRARYYDASISSFITKDTYLGNIYNPKTTNRYAYCSGDPINLRDINGHSWFDGKTWHSSFETPKPVSTSKPSTSTTKTNTSNSNQGGSTSGDSSNSSSHVSSPPPPNPIEKYIKPSIFDKLKATVSSAVDSVKSLFTSNNTVKSEVTSNTKYKTTVLAKVTSNPSTSSKETTINTLGSKLTDAFNSISTKAKQVVNDVANFVEENKTNITKVGIGVGAIAIGAIATVASGGAAAPVILAGLKTAAIAGAASAATSSAISVGKSLVTGEKIDPKSLGKTAVDSFSTGFMLGGIAFGAKSAVDAISSYNKVTSLTSKATNTSNSSSNSLSQTSSQEIEKANSKVLRNNMINSGIAEPDYPNAAHHIVAGNSPKAEQARQVLRRFGIGINDANNGVFLPAVKDVSSAAYHPSLHTKEYYDVVNDALSVASSKSDVINILNDTSSQLINGTFLKQEEFVL